MNPIVHESKAANGAIWKVVEMDWINLLDAKGVLNVSSPFVNDEAPLMPAVAIPMIGKIKNAKIKVITTANEIRSKSLV